MRNFFKYIVLCAIAYAPCRLLCAADDVSADRLTAILSGEYKARTLSTKQMDSVMDNYGTANTPKRYRLEYENKRTLYRHSFEADWYIYDSQKETRTPLTDGPARDAIMSPDGRYVTFAKQDGNLYLYKCDFKTEVPVTTDGLRDEIELSKDRHLADIQVYNGISDWLYEEEFGVTSLCAFSPDSKLVAFVKLQEQDVPAFSWLKYLKDSVPVLYPYMQSLRYPKAGQKNAVATVCVYDIYYKSVKTMQTTLKNDTYYPRIIWRTLPLTKEQVKDKLKPEDSYELVIQAVNRDQNKQQILSANPRSTVCRPLYKEESDKYYINYALFDSWQWLPDGRFVVLSEKSGWAAAYMYSQQGLEERRLTPDGIDVTAIYGYNDKLSILYYQAAPTPMTRQCYALNTQKNTLIELTPADGISALRFNKALTMCVGSFENINTPNVYTLYSLPKGDKLIKENVLEDNADILAKWQSSGLPQKQFFTLLNAEGDTLNAWRILPSGFDESRRYPVVLMQYSGPSSQQVLNRWRKGFGHYLASQGYVVINSDGRGTNARGREWRNATYKNLGQKEAEDQVATAIYAAALPYTDSARIAIIGWSYGGYQAIRSVCGTSVFKCAVAIAPVTDWRLYDSAYTERFMMRPQVNERGYNAANLCDMADKMNAKLLLVHGLADDNVHVQNTWLFTEALVKAGKQFEMQIYPDDNHFLHKSADYEHLHRRIMLFFENNL